MVTCFVSVGEKMKKVSSVFVKMILFINACVREESRTKRLADCLLSKMEGKAEELCLANISFPPVDEAYLHDRDSLINFRIR